MRLPLALLTVLLLAGCADTTAPAAEGPIALEDRAGLLLIDVPTRGVTVLSPTATLGWMSPSGGTLVWREQDYSIFYNASARDGDVTPQRIWARIEDDGTGFTFEPGRVVRRLLTNGTEVDAQAVPPGPRPDGTWTGGSADLSILGAEWPGVTGGSGCQNALAFHGPEARSDSRPGCHLRVARDGRIGWTQSTGVWIRDASGEVRDVTGTGRDVNGTFVAHENPVFPAEGAVYLRLHGQRTLERTEVVTDEGTVLATLDGPLRMALLDVSADGTKVLVRVFG